MRTASTSLSSSCRRRLRAADARPGTRLRFRRMPAWEIVDASASGPAVVLGSLPPGARDLDVAAAEPSPIAEALRAAGYVTRGHGEWARFAAGGVDAVDLLAGWPHLDEILAEAEPVPGCRRLVRPASHHALLVLAQQLAATGAYPAKRG